MGPDDLGVVGGTDMTIHQKLDYIMEKGTIDFTNATQVYIDGHNTAGTNHIVNFTPEETGLYLFFYVPYCTDTPPKATNYTGITDVLFHIDADYPGWANSTGDIIHTKIVIGTATAGQTVTFTATGSSSNYADRYRVGFQVIKLFK